MKTPLTFLGILLGHFMSWLGANNLIISNVNLVNDSTLNFQISWENSWRVDATPPYNHDAVWLFIKKRDCASDRWTHVALSTNASDHTAASPLAVYLDGRDASGAKGAFVRRSSTGLGNINNVQVSLRMVGLAPGQYDFKVFGIEMVQIPAGAYDLGDGEASSGFTAGNTGNPLRITSEDTLSAGTSPNQIYNSSTSYRPLSLPAGYPKGFREIYCMKYEISIGQYLDFVNHLTSDQAANRQITGAGARQNISGTWPVLTSSTPYRAMTGMGWPDLCAYLDWSALRPMTEMEFEKICRGPVPAVGGEYAWGTSLVTDANVVNNDGTITENLGSTLAAGSGPANFGNNSILGTIRVGYAAKAGTSRVEAGATYYGVMEMSGNAVERGVSTSNAVGTAYTGVLGDGELTNSPQAGFSDVPDWPSQTSASTTAASGVAWRGGHWNGAAGLLQTSDRSQVANNGARYNYVGGRGVR